MKEAAARKDKPLKLQINLRHKTPEYKYLLFTVSFKPSQINFAQAPLEHPDIIYCLQFCLPRENIAVHFSMALVSRGTPNF